MNRQLFPVAILAGGLAKRLRPLTESIPKALLEINKEPFIFHQLRLLHSYGIRHVVICAGYLGEKIKEVITDGKTFDLNVEYSFDGNTLLGTAGAIKHALPLLGDSFFVLYGDSYLECEYAVIQDTFTRSEKEGLMTVYRNQGQWDRSNVEFSDGRIVAYDKINQSRLMHYIDYGLGIFHKEVFRHIPDSTPYDLTTVYQKLLSQNQLAAFECKKRFYEIGSISGINELESYLLEKRKDAK